MTIQQCVGKEGSWRTFQSGVSFDVLNDYGYWLIAKVDKENNIKSIYISDATGTYLLPGSATDTHAIFGNETLSVGIVYWKVEKVDEGMMMDAKYLRIASSLDEVIVTSEAIAVSVNNPDHATVSFEKDSYTVGENVVLNIVPEEGYYVNALTINGENAIGSLANNTIEVIALTDLEFAVSIEAVATEYHFTLNDFAPTTEQNQSVIIYNRMDNIIPSNFSDFIYTGKLGFSGPRTVSTPMIVCNNLKFFFEGANVTATSTRIVLNALTWGNDDTYVRMQWNMNGQSQPYVDDYASSRDEINWQRLWFEQGYIEVTVKFDSEKGLLEWGAINAEGNFVRVYSFYSKALEGAFLSRIEGEQTDVFKNYVLNAKTSDQEVNFYTEITSDIWDDVTMKAPADKERISSAIILNYAYSTESEAVHYRATLTNDTESRQTTNQWAGMRFVLCENGTGEYKTIEVQLVNWSQRLRFKVVNYIDGATKEVAIDSNPEFAQIQTDWYEGKSLTVELVYTHTAESGALTIYVYDSLGVKHTLLESANTATASVPLYGYARNMHFSADKTANWTFSDISVWVE
ncbi:MAG: hypothetical protein J6Y43_00965, partial [Clostridia bacterium]|nr:hypothetical protein [Clostridia bacterium]